MNKPFTQGRFEDLPEKPRLPHAFFESEPCEISFASKSFGPIKLHYRKFGKGAPLFLIHGFMTTSYSWRYSFPLFGKHFTCYAIDLPGAGRSDPNLDASYAPENIALLMIEFMQQVGIYGCKTIGNSMGGYLAMQMALADAASMQKLVNLHSPGIPEMRLELLNVALNIPGGKSVLRYVLQFDPMRFVHRNVHYYDESLKSLEEAREYSATLATPGGAAALIKYFDETMNVANMKSFKARLLALQNFPLPLQLVYAKADPMVSPAIGTEFKRLIPGAELVYLPEGSHFAHVDRPALFYETALKFLQG